VTLEIDQGLADCRTSSTRLLVKDEDTMQAVEADTAALEGRVGELEFRRMFNNPMDGNACFIEIQSGAGGTEARTGPACCCAST
jgi:peptide chain release factor 2